MCVCVCVWEACQLQQVVSWMQPKQQVLRVSWRICDWVLRQSVAVPMVTAGRSWVRQAVSQAGQGLTLAYMCRCWQTATAQLPRQLLGATSREPASMWPSSRQLWVRACCHDAAIKVQANHVSWSLVSRSNQDATSETAVTGPCNDQPP